MRSRPKTPWQALRRRAGASEGCVSASASRTSEAESEQVPLAPEACCLLGPYRQRRSVDGPCENQVCRGLAHPPDYRTGAKLPGPLFILQAVCSRVCRHCQAPVYTNRAEQPTVPVDQRKRTGFPNAQGSADACPCLGIPYSGRSLRAGYRCKQ